MSLRKQFLLTLFLPLVLLIAVAAWLGIERLQKQEYKTISAAMLAQTRQHAEQLGKQLGEIADAMHTAKLLVGTQPRLLKPSVELWMQRQLATQPWVNGIGITHSDANFKAINGLWLTRTSTPASASASASAPKVNKPIIKRHAQPRNGIDAWLTDIQTRHANFTANVANQAQTAKTTSKRAYLQGYWTPPYRDENFSGDLLVSYVLPIIGASNPSQGTGLPILGLLHIDIALNRLLEASELRPQGYINQLLSASQSATSKSDKSKTSKKLASLDWILLSRQGLYLHSRFEALIGQSIFDVAAAIKRPDLGRLAEFAVRGGSDFFELPAWSAEGRPQANTGSQWITVSPVPGTAWSYGQSLVKPVAPVAYQARRLLTIGLPGILLLFAIFGLLVSGVLRQRLLDLARRFGQAEPLDTHTKTAHTQELELLAHAAQAFAQHHQQRIHLADGEHQQQLNEQLSQQQADSEKQQSDLQTQFEQDESQLQAQLIDVQKQCTEQTEEQQALRATLAKTEQQRDDLQAAQAELKVELTAKHQAEAEQHAQDLAQVAVQATTEAKRVTKDFEQQITDLTQQTEAQQAESQQEITEQNTHITELEHHQSQLEQQIAGFDTQLTLISKTRDIGLWRVNTTTQHTENDADTLHMQGSILQRLGLDPQNPPNTVAAWLKTIHETDSSRAFADFSDWISGDEDSFHLDYTAVTSSGETLPVEAWGQKIRNAEGALIEVIGSLVDLSLPQQAKLSIERADQQRQQLTQTQQILGNDLRKGPVADTRIHLQSLYQLEFPGSDLHSNLASNPPWQTIKWQTQHLLSQLEDTVQWLEKKSESQDTPLELQQAPNAAPSGEPDQQQEALDADEQKTLSKAFDLKDHTLDGRKLLVLDSPNKHTDTYLSNLAALGLSITWVQDNSAVCEYLESNSDTGILIRLDDQNMDIDGLLILLAADSATAELPVIGLTDNPRSAWQIQQSRLSTVLTEPVDYTTWLTVLSETLPEATNPHVDSAAELPSMAGIDTQIGLINHQSDTPQYLDSLNAFATEHVVIANQLEQALVQGDKQQSLQLSEELRNRAEKIGAHMLFETLKALHNVIQRCRDKAEIQAISLAPTHAALRHVSSSIVALAQPSVTPRLSPSINSVDLEQFSHRFRDLSLLLHDKESAASDCLAAIRSRFGNSEHGQDLDLIAGHIERENYAAASRVLAAIMAGLDIT